MKQFQLVTQKTYEGVDASVPSIKECESWAKTEDEALTQVIERLMYFLSLPKNSKYVLDRSHREDSATYYTIMVDV